MEMIVEESSKEGMESLLGEIVTVFCMCYFYTGKLVGVNSTCIKLQDPYIVYETGSFSDKGWKDAQKLPQKFWYVSTATIESFGQMK